ncbi:hypothetical protein [Anabaena catenula]|uniref:Uncharacterized protein n=1 Tax=Anabaena catenula FACHB-362 TaxID=2692877 RepID=A0ABR8J330_9NOST|nr:hypothetical protein [Anabaena catenula]MBD2691902.1 hypothetical protein [Anabaena catenula FACHB-362]
MLTDATALIPAWLKSAIFRNPLLVTTDTTVMETIAMLATGITQMSGDSLKFAALYSQ